MPVDGRLVQAVTTQAEAGRALDWQLGRTERQAFVFEDVAGLAWSVAHLRAREAGGEIALSWVPRGEDIPDSWDRPDPVRTRQFRVEASQDDEVLQSLVVSQPSAMIASGADLVSVAEIGTDGREGHRVSIAPGAS